MGHVVYAAETFEVRSDGAVVESPFQSNRSEELASNAAALFNAAPEDGIKFLHENGLVSPLSSFSEILQILISLPSIDFTKLTEHITQHELWSCCLLLYDFSDMLVDIALRLFCKTFMVTKADRNIVACFCDRYIACNQHLKCFDDRAVLYCVVCVVLKLNERHFGNRTFPTLLVFLQWCKDALVPYNATQHLNHDELFHGIYKRVKAQPITSKPSPPYNVAHQYNNTMTKHTLAKYNTAGSMSNQNTIKQNTIKQSLPLSIGLQEIIDSTALYKTQAFEVTESDKAGWLMLSEHVIHLNRKEIKKEIKKEWIRFYVVLANWVLYVFEDMPQYAYEQDSPYCIIPLSASTASYKTTEDGRDRDCIVLSCIEGMEIFFPTSDSGVKTTKKILIKGSVEELEEWFTILCCLQTEPNALAQASFKHTVHSLKINNATQNNTIKSRKKITSPQKQVYVVVPEESEKGWVQFKRKPLQVYTKRYCALVEKKLYFSSSEVENGWFRGFVDLANIHSVKGIKGNTKFTMVLRDEKKVRLCFVSVTNSSDFSRWLQAFTDLCENRKEMKSPEGQSVGSVDSPSQQPNTTMQSPVLTSPDTQYNTIQQTSKYNTIQRSGVVFSPVKEVRRKATTSPGHEQQYTTRQNDASIDSTESPPKPRIQPPMPPPIENENTIQQQTLSQGIGSSYLSTSPSSDTGSSPQQNTIQYNTVNTTPPKPKIPPPKPPT